jgi:hypothetical protein
MHDVGKAGKRQGELRGTQELSSPYLLDCDGVRLARKCN